MSEPNYSIIHKELKSHATELERRNEYLCQELAKARNRPLVALAKKLSFKTLKLLSRATPLVPSRIAERFSRSAQKRDPYRDDFSVLFHENEFPFTYKMVLTEWARKRAAQAPEIDKLAAQLSNGPLVSIIMLVAASETEILEKAVCSILAQSYNHWELHFVLSSTDDLLKSRVSEIVKAHSNISYSILKRDENSAERLNAAIERARGSFVAVVSHEGVFDQDALLFVAKELEQNPNCKIVYTDDDRISVDGNRYQPHFKPDWNRDLFYGTNYISQLVIFDRKTVCDVGGFRSECSGAEQYDLILRCVEEIQDSHIGHIPKVLYSSRANAFCLSTQHEQTKNQQIAAKNALRGHLERFYKQSIKVHDGPMPFTFCVEWPLTDKPLVSIIIPTKDQLQLTQTAVESIIKKTDYPNFEIVLVDNGSVEPETLSWFERIEKQTENLRVLRDDRPFNYSALNNNAVEQSNGDVIALVNNDIEVGTANWLSEMVALAVRPDTGCVGAKLYFPNGTIQHAGVRVGFDGVCSHPYASFPADHSGYFGRLVLRQGQSAVTAACLVVRRSVYAEVGGLNETNLPVAYNDIDFCLKVQLAGYRNVWTPWAELTHHESATRGKDTSSAKKARVLTEIKYMKDTWKTDNFDDPAYNKNLVLQDLDWPCAKPVWKV